MTDTVVEHGFTRAGFQAFLDGRDEPRWLRDLRSEYFDKFDAAAMPSNRDEEWRRTDIRLLKLGYWDAPWIRKDFAVRSLDGEPVFAELLAGLDRRRDELGARLAAGVPWLEGAGADAV